MSFSKPVRGGGSGRDIRSFFLKPNEEKKVPNVSSECTPVPSTSQASTSTYFKPSDNLSGELQLNTGRPVEENDLGNLASGPCPCRPILAQYPTTDFSGTKRFFNKQYYETYEWLEYSINKDAVFCFPCRMFSSSTSGKEDTFTKKGMRNWRKTAAKLDKHSECDTHRFSMSKWKNYKAPSENVLAQVSESHKTQIVEKKEYVKKIIDILLYLARQGLALRGHDESINSENKGNFLELCDLFSKYNPSFKSKYEKYFNLTGSNTQNELIHIISEEVLRQIVQEVNTAEFYALLVDEAKSHKTQQLCICIRYFYHNQIKERLIAMKDVSLSRDADNLSQIILDSISNMGISATLVGQSYDGASVMSGVNNGVQAVVQRSHPYANYVHCMAHTLNLVLVAVCNSNDLSCQFFCTMQALFKFFSSPDSNAMFVDLQKQLKIVTNDKKKHIRSIVKQSDTRWSCRATAISVVEDLFKPIIDVLNIFATDLRHTRSPEAKGILASILSIEFIVCLMVFSETLTYLNVLSKALQKEGNSIASCSLSIKGAIKILEGWRNEEKWDQIWKKVIQSAKENCIPIPTDSSDESRSTDMSLPESSKRRRVLSSRLDSYVVITPVGHRPSDNVQNPNADGKGSAATAKANFRTSFYYPVLDILLAEMKRRFSEDSLKLATSCEQFLRLNVEKSVFFINSYPIGSVNVKSLKAEMQIANLVMREKKDTENVLINLETSSLKKIIPALIESVNDRTYPNLYKMMCIAFTLPSNSATCERTFSAMRRINNWLRSTMNEERLSDLMVLFSESDIVKAMDYDKLANLFLSKGGRK